MRIFRQPRAGRGRAGYDGGGRAVTAAPRLAVRLHGGMRAQDCVAQAAAAEAAGFASVWFAENPFARGILPAATACVLATRRIAIGAGVFNPFSRHPSLIAMEIGALDELAGGRVRLGIGSGIGSAVERMGLSYARPLTAVTEAIAIVRALLRGEEVTYRGKLFSVERVKLDYVPRRDIPIFMAARGDFEPEACRGSRRRGHPLEHVHAAFCRARGSGGFRRGARRRTHAPARGGAIHAMLRRCRSRSSAARGAPRDR